MDAIVNIDQVILKRGHGCRLFIVVKQGRKLVHLFYPPRLLHLTIERTLFGRSATIASDAQPRAVARTIRRNRAQARRLGRPNGGKWTARALAILDGRQTPSATARKSRSLDQIPHPPPRAALMPSEYAVAHIRQFVERWCRREKDWWESRADLYSAYDEWAKARIAAGGDRYAVQPVFEFALGALGFRNGGGRTKRWHGIRLNRSRRLSARHTKHVEEFFEACCVPDLTCDEQSAALWNVYLGWCSESARTPVTRTAFGRALGALGYDSERGHTVRWVGMRLKLRGSAGLREGRRA
jgi:hypothetical protein